MRNIINFLFIFLLLITLLGCSRERSQERPQLKSITLVEFGGSAVGFRTFDMHSRSVREISLSPKCGKQSEDCLVIGRLRLKDDSCWNSLYEVAGKIQRSGGIISSLDLAPGSLVTLTYGNGVSKSFFFFAANYHINRWLFRGRSEELQLAQILLLRVNGERSETVLMPGNKEFHDAALDYEQHIANAQCIFDSLVKANRGWRSYLGGLNGEADSFFLITNWARGYISKLVKDLPKAASGNNPQLNSATFGINQESGNP